MTQQEKEAYLSKVTAVFEGYTGEHLYGVYHPDYEDEIIVKAPDHDSAMVTASKVWGRQWTKIDFYAYAIVRRIA